MNNLLLEVKDGVAVISINRPQALNALNSETLIELDACVSEVEKNDDVKVVILTGAGEKSFVAGADIGEMLPLTAVEGKAFGRLGNDVFLKIERLSKPVIAAVNGFALGGGCELAMSCDIRLASEKAKFGQPEVGLGITPGFGGTQRLARIVGTGKAMELILTAKTINAAEAEKIGLVNAVYPPEELMDKAVEMAKAIAANAQIAVRECKACIRRGIQTDIDTGIAYETEAFGLCFSTADQKEGMSAFVEKRKEKNFIGK